MDLELRDKVAIVGGASKGLGRACAEVLAEEGCRVAVCSRSKDDLAKAADEIRAATGREVLAFPGDLDRPETIRDLVAATVARFGRLDVLVNNSGGPPLARAHNATRYFAHRRESAEKLHPMQEAFIKHDGFQCGYCTSGQIMSAVACIREGHAGSEDEIRESMSGNICRCGAYPNIVNAIKEVKEGGLS